MPFFQARPNVGVEGTHRRTNEREKEKLLVKQNDLHFDLSKMLEQWVAERLPAKSIPEGCEDLIVAEMESCGLRAFVGDEVLFDNGKSVSEYRVCIERALDRWTIEVSRNRTPEEVADYYRSCGE